MTVEAIGERSGFSSRSAFYEAFRRGTGSTPDRDRERRGQGSEIPLLSTAAGTSLRWQYFDVFVTVKSLLLTCALFAAILLGGCGGGEEEPSVPPVLIPTGLYADAEVMVVPDQRWRPSDAAWAVAGEEAALGLLVPEGVAPPSALEARLGGGGIRGVELELDGAALEVHQAGDGVEVSLPPLEQGMHRLVLRRPADEQPLSLEELTLHGEEWSHAADLGRFHQHRILYDHLHYGVTGLTAEKLGGVVFAGPRTETIAVPAGGALTTTVENASHSPATFVLRAGSSNSSVEVPPAQRGRLALEVDEGSAELTVVGAERGVYLFGRLFLERSQPRDSRPPIVLVTLDTTRKDALAPYGGPPEVTPHLARFARGATVFTRAHATSPWTVPSHGSMFTGLYPREHGGGVTSERMPMKAETLPEVLRRKGYFTAGFAGGLLLHHHFGLGQGFHVYRDPDGFETKGDVLSGYWRDVLSTAPMPLFLFVNYFDPHAPYEAPKPYRERLGVEAKAEAAPEATVRRFARGDREAFPALAEAKIEVGEAGKEALRAAYLAEVAFSDAQLGELFTALRERGLYDEALVVVTADHGELLGEDGLFFHSYRLDPELVEVPLIVKWPGQREGFRIEALTSIVDVFPTILRAAEVTVPQQRGLLLKPRQAGRMLDRREVVFYEEHHAPFHPLTIEPMRIADDLVGIQRLEERATVWAGGSRCDQLVEDRWKAARCPSATPGLDQALALVGEPAETRTEAAGKLSTEAEKGLRALGYIQ